MNRTVFSLPELSDTRPAAASPSSRAMEHFSGGATGSTS